MSTSSTKRPCSTNGISSASATSHRWQPRVPNSWHSGIISSSFIYLHTRIAQQHVGRIPRVQRLARRPMHMRHDQRTFHQTEQLPGELLPIFGTQAPQLLQQVTLDEGLVLGGLAMDRMFAVVKFGSGMYEGA